MDINALLNNQDWHQLVYVMLVFGWDDFFIALALLVVSATITALTTKKPQSDDAVAAQIGDFQVPTITEGTPQTVVFGDVWLTSWQVLWYGDLESDAIRSQSSGGKK